MFTQKILFTYLLINTCFLANLFGQSKYSDFSESQLDYVFNEQFDNNNNNWSTGTAGERVGKVKYGYYHWESQIKSSGSTWKDIDLDETKDFQIETRIKFVTGNQYNFNGINWGRSSDGDTFTFGFNGNGEKRSARLIDNEYESIIDWEEESAINKDGYNKLTVRKVRNNYYFFINEVLVKTKTFEPFFGNRIGFMCGTNTIINIDYLTVGYLKSLSASPANYSAYSSSQKRNIFFDDFNNNYNNWSTGTPGKRIGKVANGYYSWESLTDQAQLTSKEITIDEDKDWEMEAKIKFVEGKELSANGLLWGYENVNIHSYDFIFNGNGSYKIDKYEGSYDDYVKWTESSSVNKYGFNKLTIRKVGQKLYFFINDQFLYSMANKKFFGQRVAFQVAPKTKVHIDYLRVSYLDVKSVADFKSYGYYSSSQKEAVFSDDFNNDNNNWDLSRSSDQSSNISNGYLYFEHYRKSGAWSKYRKIEFDESQDFEIETRLKVITKGDGGYLNALIWGKEGTSDFRLGYNNFGSFRICKTIDGDWSYFIPWTKNEHLDADGFNKLTVRKIGANYYLYINESLVHSMPYEPVFGERVGYLANMSTELQVDYLRVSYLKKKGVSTIQTNVSANTGNVSPGNSPTAPAYLVTDNLIFSDTDQDNQIDGGETTNIKFVIRNMGKGAAKAMQVKVSEQARLSGLEFNPSHYLGDLAPGAEKEVIIPVKGNMQLQTGQANFHIEVLEDNGFDADPIKITIPTYAFMPPELEIVDYQFSSEMGGKMALGIPITLKMAVQNVGQGKAENVKLNLSLPANVFSAGDNSFTIGSLSAGESKTIDFEFFTNKRYTDTDVPVTAQISEGSGSFGKTKSMAVKLNQQLQNSNNVVVSSKNISVNTPIRQVSLSSDVDKNIPQVNLQNPDAIAVVIGNKDYKNTDVPTVDFAIQDAQIMKRYLIEAFGFDENNIIYFANASQSDFNSTFGKKGNYKAQLYNLIKPGKSDVFVFYSGHGAPDPESKEGYFVPVDCNPSLVAFNGYSINTFYENLAQMPYRNLTIVVDACFSGSSDQGMLLHNISPVFIKTENKIKASENSLVFTSAAGDQVSSWYPEKKHSLFTYYFLKGLQGEADANKDGVLNMSEMSAYLKENVTYMARRLNNRTQTPELYGFDDKVIMRY